jgi:hypothetical protein
MSHFCLPIFLSLRLLLYLKNLSISFHETLFFLFLVFVSLTLVRPFCLCLTIVLLSLSFSYVLLVLCLCFLLVFVSLTLVRPFCLYLTNPCFCLTHSRSSVLFFVSLLLPPGFSLSNSRPSVSSLSHYRAFVSLILVRSS